MEINIFNNSSEEIQKETKHFQNKMFKRNIILHKGTFFAPIIPLKAKVSIQKILILEFSTSTPSTFKRKIKFQQISFLRPSF